MDPSKLLDAPDPMELAQAKAMADVLPVDFVRLLDPLTTDPEWLPFLAVSVGVKLWFDDWSIDRKRQIVAQWPDIAASVGQHRCAVTLLSFVDAEIIDHIAYPARFVAGKSSANVTPVGFPPFKARYLVKVLIDKPFNAYVAGYSAAGRMACRTVNDEPIKRAKQALLLSKAPEAEYTINTMWRSQNTLKDAVGLDDGVELRGYRDRNRLQ